MRKREDDDREREEEEDDHKEREQRDEREEPSEEGRQFYRYDGTCTFCRISSVISAGTGYTGKIICRT